MATLIPAPTLVVAAGTPPKQIEEYVGLVNSNDPAVSIARMVSPPGWEEPAQTPEFDEYTLILRGSLLVSTREGSFEVKAGQAIVVHRGERVQYRSPDGAEYIAVCLPAFSPDTVHREK